MASTSASSVQKSFKYDVFLSFRGEDTRKNFVDHLYHALHQKSIITYKDDEKIQKGERISDQLIRSIQESRFYIIVFSKNYASSSWCLDELAEIVKCQKMAEHTAYPVFYDVEPTEVRHQSGQVGEAFAKHVAKGKGKWIEEDADLENEDDVGRWRNALKDAAGLAGWELKNTVDGHEAKFIEKVVNHISLKLSSTHWSVDETLVGMDTRVKNVISSLSLGCEDVRMIGIKGIGGGGKTTLARVVFDHISNWFEGNSFVENVREVSKSSFSGLKKLQKQVLKDVLNDQSIDVKDVYDGSNKMKKMLGSRKVLVVLDDVDNIVQLEALAGNPNWFKSGSRIIITTRDEQVLIAHRVHFIHDVNLLSNAEAIFLFSRYAFGREVPFQGYEELSGRVVHYAAGLPLTIKVLGSHLCGRSELEWVDATNRLKDIPLKETLEKLELSYNGLENDQKEIFLDVVCILKGEKKERAIRILESCGFNAHIGLRVLEQKSLITISIRNGLGFHDHIEEMGKNIVRRSHPNEPRRHSRLWIKDEIEDILVNESGSEETRSIKLYSTDIEPEISITLGFIRNMNSISIDIDPEIIMKGLQKMKELRLLYLDEGFREFKGDEFIRYIPDALRCLCLPKKYFGYYPKIFESYNPPVWERGERKILDKLRYIDFSESKLKTFDLGMTPRLETLDLARCLDFEELHMPIECPNLKFLSLSHSKVSNLNLQMTPLLEELDLEGCSNLQEIHAPVGCLKNLVYLNLCGRDTFGIRGHHNLRMGGHNVSGFNGCSRFRGFSIKKQNVLPGLDSSAKLKLKVLPLDICPLHPNNNLPTLRFECYYDEPLPSSSGNLEKLLSFGLCACTNLESFSASICGLQNLRELTLKGRIPKVLENLGQIQGLENLYLRMKEIKHLPDSICMLKHLKCLELKSCFLLEKLPKDLGRLECLEELHLTNCRSLRDIPKSICKMKSLNYLNLSYCHQVMNLPEEIGCLECLEKLDLKECRSLRDIPNNIYQMKRLTYLNISGCHYVEKLPETFGQIKCLEWLYISGTSIQHLPEGIYHLKGLNIYGSKGQLDSFGFTFVTEISEDLHYVEL